MQELLEAALLGLAQVSAATADAQPLVDAAVQTQNAAQPIVDAAAQAAQPLVGAAVELTQTTEMLAPAALAGTTDVPVMTQEAASTGMLHFIAQSDWVGKSLFVILLLMSLASWYLIFAKAFVSYRLKRRSNNFLREFWAASSLEQVENEIATHGANEPFAHLASHAIHSRNHHVRYGALKLEEKGSTDSFVMRIMRKVIDEETARLENGLTLLASVGSTAPFVGLFGTVWGVYHALINIGLSDEVALNKISGPVGEALIMTGLGLAVAIPAVLAYNAFVRTNRVYLAKLDAFAHDLFTFLTTGQQVPDAAGNGRGPIGTAPRVDEPVGVGASVAPVPAGGE